MSETSRKIELYGASWCPYCMALKRYLDKKSIDYVYHDVDDKAVEAEMLERTGGKYLIPVLIIDNELTHNPATKYLEEKFGSKPDSIDHLYDVVMIGAGPSALSAAIYTTREDLETLCIEKGVVGGMAAITDQVDNYPGFAEGVTGLGLATELENQANRFGNQIEYAEVTKIEQRDHNMLALQTSVGEISTKSVLIATGSDWKRLGVPGEEEFFGRGVHFCATCDGAFYRDKRLVVVGGGNSAVQEAMFLTKFASKIDLLVRGDKLRASEVLQHELENHKDKITIHYNTSTDEIIGEDSKVVGVKVTAADGSKNQIDTDGVFVFIGLKPTTQFAADSGIELDEFGFVKTDENLMTNMPGVFASGDVRSGATMQIASAVGEGATAALKIREYLKSR
jgi:thioredoxin reductase (NADPH)